MHYSPNKNSPYRYCSVDRRYHSTHPNRFHICWSHCPNSCCSPNGCPHLLHHHRRQRRRVAIDPAALHQPLQLCSAVRIWWANCRCRDPYSGWCSRERPVARTVTESCVSAWRAADPVRSVAASSRRPWNHWQTLGRIQPERREVSVKKQILINITDDFCFIIICLLLPWAADSSDWILPQDNDRQWFSWALLSVYPVVDSWRSPTPDGRPLSLVLR